MWRRLYPLLLTLTTLAGCAAVDTQKAPGAQPAAAVAPTPSAAGGYAGWAAVVVSGDWQSGDGYRSSTFDNARRDLADAFVRIGFSPANMRQFSAWPEGAPPAGKARFDEIAASLAGLATQAAGGCLVYVTSHGSEDGVVIGRSLVSPWDMADLLDRACPDRPAVVVISACHSGVFIDRLSAPDRLIVAAARGDRTSFGCGQDSRYPYFDECVLQSLPTVADFPALARTARACVAMREKAEGFQHSLPQISLGATAAQTLPRLRFPGR